MADLRTERRSWRKGTAAVVLLAAAAFGVVLDLSIGPEHLSLGQVIHGLLDGGETVPAIIVRQIRGPRTELAVMVGASLATSGALLQGFSGNPLADAGLLGINGGASLAIVAVTYFAGSVSLTGAVWYALIGAALATITVELLSRTVAQRNSATLILGGAVLAALISSVISVLLVLGSENLPSFIGYQVGSLTGRVPGTFSHTAPFAAVGLIIGLTRGRALNAIALGDDVARSLGVHVARQEMLIVVAVALMAGSSVAAAGPIGFVGLAAPFLVRLMVGGDNRWVLPLSALAGAALVLYADTLAQIVVPGGLQDGIVIDALGAPVLILAVHMTTGGRR